MASEEEHSHHHASPGTARVRLAIAFGITSVIVLAQALGSVKMMGIDRLRLIN